MAPDEKKHINYTNGFDCTIKQKKNNKKSTGNKVRNVEVNVGIMTSQSGCKVMPCDLLHASTENIVTGR